MYRECISCNDILLVPRYSEIESRTQCDPSFLNYSLPIIASCMNTVYSPEIDKFLTENKVMVMVHRYFKNFEEQLNFALEPKSNDYRFFAVGSISRPEGKEWIDGLLNAGITHFVVDMAHGDTGICANTVDYINMKIGNSGKIIAGNVATKSGFRRLEKAGAWAIRCGIGSGCFVPETLVKTSNGMKQIKDIKIGDLVYTHTGELEEVIVLISYETKESLIKINNKIKCTQNHEFYVVNKKYKDVVNEDNMDKYAEWKRADELTEDYMMIELE